MQVISGNCRSIFEVHRYFAARKLIDQQTLERKLQNYNNNSKLTVFYYLGYVHRVLMDFIRLFYYQIF